jgi:tetratricopeptide (TPR) repeat protein
MQFLKTLARKPKVTHAEPSLSLEQDYSKAMQLLAQAHEEQFTQPQTLKQAAELFISAIRSNDRDPAPMLGMAYLLLLLEEYPQATLYVQAALKVDPRNQTAMNLEAVLKDRLSEKPGSDAGLFSEEADYEQIEDYLKAEIQLISQLVPPAPLTEVEPLVEMESGFIRLREMHGALLTKLARLGQEFESLSLRQQLRPIEARIKQFENAIVLSHQLLDLRERMEQEREAALCLCQYLCYQNAEQAFTQLEIILDSCDQIAMEINTLDSRGVDIHVLEADYQLLSDALMLFQNTLDEMKNEPQSIKEESLIHAG